MQPIDVLGAVAVLISTGSLVPQLIKTWRTRSADDLSFGWLTTALLGAGLWLAYGSMKADWAVAIGNIIGGTLVTFLLVMKMRFSRR